MVWSPGEAYEKIGRVGADWERGCAGKEGFIRWYFLVEACVASFYRVVLDYKHGRVVLDLRSIVLTLGRYHILLK